MISVQENCRLGALVGALVGDAAGATLEFYRGTFNLDLVKNAMSMPGGGVLSVAPGQITDDGELMLALLSALKKHPPSEQYPVKDVVAAYSDWLKSDPFDCGHTCMKAFRSIQETNSIGELIATVAEFNEQSEANGALMRVMPIATHYFNQRYDTIAAYAKMDAKLSHPSQVCQDVNALYSIALAELINYPRDNEGVFITLDEYIAKHNVCDTVQTWLEESKNDYTTFNCRKNIGHVKHAFTLAFHFLRRDTPYEEAIQQTLLLGGDTDTNACIVGGLIGALHGFESIPEYMRECVLDFDCVKHDQRKTLLGHRRPEAYKALNAFTYVIE